MYKLTFEVVDQDKLYLYSNADPRWYSNTTQIVPNSEIPDEHWHLVEKQASTEEELTNQYNKLKEWADSDKEFVRNPKIYRAADPEWVIYRA